jgi:hypothetical protein
MVSEITSDIQIRTKLNALSVSEPNYWSYSGRASRTCVHDYFQYPAMMVPDMLSDLIRVIRGSDPNVKTIYDPFAGSGSVLTETMLLGLDFVGGDINPLAVLLCKAKSGPFCSGQLEDKLDDLLSSVESDNSNRREASFPNLTKWFEPRVVQELSKLRRAIRAEPALWARRFFWVALAETVRRTSNSRTSTFKLHIRTSKDIQSRSLSPVAAFEDVASANIARLDEQSVFLAEQQLLTRGKYKGTTDIFLRSAHLGMNGKQSDLLVTSPPYGDNRTTVPYGQHAYLPLQWIDFGDIDHSADRAFLASTHEIDKRSLGGLRKVTPESNEELERISPTFSQTLHNLKYCPADRQSRVASFCRDLHRCIKPILDSLRKNAYMVWVIGNRRVGGEEIPMVRIASEFLVGEGSIPILTIKRVIPTKRMALKNSVTQTMCKEAILVFRRK